MSTDPTRPTLHEPYVARPNADDHTHGVLCATNGHAAVMHRVELHPAETTGHVAPSVAPCGEYVE